MKQLLEIIDYYICQYIGLDKKEVIPDVLKKTGNRFILVNTEPFKRHIYSEKWEDFLLMKFEEMSESTKQKIGISMGKSLAKNLVISFDKTKIMKKK
jgi:hypothetical protein